MGLFEVPVTINVATPKGAKDFPVTVSKADETFSFPAETQPLMVLFDKGDKLLKSVEFQKSPVEWIYQLQHASEVPDRADAARALGNEKGNEAAAAALGEAALHDPFWGVRDESLLALGRIGSGDAEKVVIAALANKEPWVREQAVTQLGHFREDSSLTSRLAQIFHDDPAYRVRAAALGALGQIKAPDARETLEAAAKIDSPDDVIRRAALRAMGLLGDDRSARTLLEWSSEGQPVRLRAVAIGSLARVDKKNADIESKLLAYLNDSSFDIRFAALSALGERGDPAAIGPLTALLNGNDMTSGLEPVIEEQLARLKNAGAGRNGEESAGGPAAAPPGNLSPDAPANQASNPTPPNQRGGQQGGTQVVERLDRLERTLAEMNDRLKRIEQEIPAKAGQ